MHVPENLLDHFGEMFPIFCNAEIPFEAVGEYTQNTARKLQVSENPRRLLVGGVRARKIVLATPFVYGTRTGDIPRLSSCRIYPKSLFCGFYGGS